MFNSEPPPKSAPPKHVIFIRTGLEDQDDNLDILQVYFEALRTMTVETSMAPDLDLLTFALSAHYFGVIMMEDHSCIEKYREGSQQVTPEAPQTSASTEPVIAVVPPPITEEEFLALSEKEKFERWVEAFQAKMKGQCGPDLDLDDGLDDVRSRREAAASAEDKSMRRETPQREPDFFPANHFIPESQAINAFINWPDDAASDGGGPPSTIADDVWADHESSIGSPFDFDEDRYHCEDKFDDNFGREYLEPEMGPACQPTVIPQDPKLQELIKEAAIQFRDQLRARTVHLYEKRKAELAQQHAVAIEKTPEQPAYKELPLTLGSNGFTKTTPIGIVYLTTSQNYSDPLHVGECNFGIYIAPEHWNKGRVSQVMHTVIEDAFKDQNCHRVQAILVDHEDIFDYLNLYASAGFRHEGVLRRAFFSSITSEWKDITYLAILATEWLHDRNTHSPRARLLPCSLWDAILSRHQREQEEFVWMEERKSRTGPSSSKKRSSSLETIREAVPCSSSNQESGAETTETTDAATSSTSPSVPRNKKRKFNSRGKKARQPSVTSSESGLSSGWDNVASSVKSSASVGSKIDPQIPRPPPAPSGRRHGRKSSVSSSSSWSALE